jgi:hypothetical protein
MKIRTFDFDFRIVEAKVYHKIRLQIPKLGAHTTSPLIDVSQGYRGVVLKRPIFCFVVAHVEFVVGSEKDFSGFL